MLYIQQIIKINIFQNNFDTPNKANISITPDEALVETRQKLVKEKIFGSILEKMLTFGHILNKVHTFH